MVTFRTTASAMLNKFCKTPKLRDPEAEKLRMVEAAAELIKNEVKCLDTFLAVSRTLMTIFHLGKEQSICFRITKAATEKKAVVKIVSVGEGIVQAASPE